MARKVFVRTHQGWHAVERARKPVWHQAEAHRFSDLLDMARQLEQLGDAGYLITRAALRPDARPSRCRRTVNPDGRGGKPSCSRVPRSWVCVDVDGLEVDADPLNGTEVAEEIRERLPAEFHRASCIWHLSSSHLVKPGAGARAHLFFLLSRPWSSRALYQTMQAICQAGMPALDPSTNHDVQPIYLAPPKFIGGRDPIPQRWGLLLDDDEPVELQSRKPADPEPLGGDGRGAGVDWRSWAERMGSDGHYRSWILRAVNAFVASAGGRPSRQAIGELKATLRRLAGNDTRAAGYVTDHHLDDLIRSAIRRGLGAGVRRAREQLPLSAYEDGRIRL